MEPRAAIAHALSLAVRDIVFNASCCLATPGIFYKPVIQARRPMIDILHCRGTLNPPFLKERARDRVVWAAMRTKQA
jgi:hypothetical protein